MKYLLIIGLFISFKLNAQIISYSYLEGKVWEYNDENWNDNSIKLSLIDTLNTQKTSFNYLIFKKNGVISFNYYKKKNIRIQRITPEGDIFEDFLYKEDEAICGNGLLFIENAKFEIKENYLTLSMKGAYLMDVNFEFKKVFKPSIIDGQLVLNKVRTIKNRIEPFK
jgi:hypothetical protein